MRALVRPPSPSLARCALTFRERQPIDFERAVRQHEAYVAALHRCDVEVRTLPPAEDLPDAVFVEDTAVVVDECAVITLPGIASRVPEIDSVAAALESVRPIIRILPPGTLEGGDVLQVGRTIVVGQTRRSNAAGATQLAKALAPYEYEVLPVNLTGCLHLKSAVTYVGNETVLVNPDWIDVDLFGRHQCVPIAPEEPHAANALLVGEIVHLAASAPLTRRKLDALGFSTASLDTSEFEKAEAALTCLSLLFR